MFYLQHTHILIREHHHFHQLVLVTRLIPLKILNVHEGTREDGHGLGMWMVNNTIYKLNGNISIDGETNGFNLKAEMYI